MQPLSHKAGSQSRKVKLAHSYQELLHEFSSKDLRTVGNYALGRLIGKGSFGKVYLASHKLTNGSKVVLKSAKKDDSNLAREIHHHRQFIHPHIARLYEVIITENLVWLVLEYCPGDELYNYLLKHGTLSVEKVQKVFTQLVGAVAYVHAASCVHRDLKLENIMLDRNENVKLCDFGFTREYEGKGNYLQTYCGTVAYSAPEMIKGEKYAGEKVDVWSLGVILYALLCGELPFDEDDENATRMKILTSEPKWPSHLTSDARSLLGLLLSKRTLIRPTLSDILEHPFLNEYAPQQQAILKYKHPPPFSTQLEKETLQRMRSAGVDVDQVIENVMAKSCDALAGWWALLIEKEQRKQQRRERKRKERETENRGSRRLSGASNGRLDLMSTSIAGICEEGLQTRPNESPKIRGRKERRSTHFSDENQDLPGLPEHSALFTSEVIKPPPPIEKDALRSSSSSRQRRPPPPPKEGTIRGAKSRGSTLQLVTPNHELLDSKSNSLMVRTPRRRHQHPFINQLAHWKHWIIDSAKRTKSPNRKSSRSTIELHEKTSTNPRIEMTSPSSKPATSKATLTKPTMSSWSQSNPPTKYSNTNSKSKIQTSMPLTPRGTFRYSNIGLRGRKSTSSSVSSVRSIHHHNHTHSKASSTSSDCSISTSKFSLTSRSSPHHSVKVLPATPIAGSFPSNIRVVRQPTSLTLNEVPWRNNASGGIVFAKRKKKILKGPMLGISSPTGTSLVCHSRSTSQGGRGSGEIIQEEDEEDIEEVDAFSPTAGPGEIEEPVFPTGEALNDIKVMLESG